MLRPSRARFSDLTRHSFRLLLLVDPTSSLTSGDVTFKIVGHTSPDVNTRETQRKDQTMTSELRSLTASQFEILECLWEIGPPGGTTGEVWEQISSRRKVGRTTILKAMERLESYGWLNRTTVKGAIRYWPSMTRDRVERKVMAEVMEGFFHGSPNSLVKCLLGSGALTKRDAAELRQLLDEAKNKPRRERRK